VSTSDLVTGHTQSCGCLNAEIRKSKALRHGFNRTPTYICWSNMRSRCSNPRQRSYASYGGRGITVCERWQTFENFLADMGAQPAGLTIDRIDVNGSYEPGNCRWASQEVQDNNKRTTVYVVLDDRRMSMSQAAAAVGCSPGRVRYAVQRHGDSWLSFVRAAAQMAPPAAQQGDSP
jgi:hypothetical protein